MNRTLSGSLSPNQLLRRRYSILEKIGEGSFGAVYKAKDTQLGNRLVALKEMVEDNPSQLAVANFRQEAYMLAALHHPYLPSIHEHFKEAGYWYLVMDFIEGETLQAYLDKHKREGKLPLTEGKDLKQVLEMGIQLCTVLDYLHLRQPPIIFRDLKPLNIMKTCDGHLYLIDFGIARHFKAGQAKDTLILGSPGYAAPEQYGKAQSTPRADLYSLGATLHQLLTGDDPSEKPFHFAPLSTGAIPAELATLIMQMVELDADKRPASAKEVKEQLQLIVTQLSQYPSPPQPPLHLALRATAPVGPPPPGLQPPLHVPQRNPTPSASLLKRRTLLIGLSAAAGLALAATQHQRFQRLLQPWLSTSSPTLRPDRILTPQKTTTPEVPKGTTLETLGRHTSYADPPAGGRAPGATGSQGFLCFINLPPQIPYVETTDSHEDQSNGNADLVCHFTTAPPPRTVILTGWPCSTSAGTTTDSRAIYAESGEIIIICHYPGS